MPTEHLVKRGEGLASIAFTYGFFPDTIWRHERNASLVKQRSNPNALLPGDVLYIPDRVVGSVPCATGSKHRFRRRAIPEILRLQVLANGAPRGGVPYEIEIDGSLRSGTTDSDGVINEPISPDARRGMLRIAGQSIVLAFGYLEPVNVAAGAQQRLTNLGFDCGNPDGILDADTVAAIRRFQERFGLTITGELDTATLAEIERAHDSARTFPQTTAATAET
jgi:hypothetical protein